MSLLHDINHHTLHAITGGYYLSTLYETFNILVRRRLHIQTIRHVLHHSSSYDTKIFSCTLFIIFFFYLQVSTTRITKHKFIYMLFVILHLRKIFWSDNFRVRSEQIVSGIYFISDGGKFSMLEFGGCCCPISLYNKQQLFTFSTPVLLISKRTIEINTLRGSA